MRISVVSILAQGSAFKGSAAHSLLVRFYTAMKFCGVLVAFMFA